VVRESFIPGQPEPLAIIAAHLPRFCRNGSPSSHKAKLAP
jgi:hypothetical protein